MRPAAGSLLRWPPPRKSAAASRRLELAAPGAESERERLAASSRLRRLAQEPGSPQPAAPLLLSVSSLRGFTGSRGWARPEAERKAAAEAGSMEGNLAGWGSGLGSGSSSSGRRSRAPMPGPGVRAPAARAGGRSEGEPAWGWRGEPAHSRAAEGKPLRGSGARGSSSAAPGRLMCKASPAPPSLCKAEGACRGRGRSTAQDPPRVAAGGKRVSAKGQVPRSLNTVTSPPAENGFQKPPGERSACFGLPHLPPKSKDFSVLPQFQGTPPSRGERSCLTRWASQPQSIDRY